MVSEQYREYNDDEILLLIDGMSKEELKDMFEQHNMEAQRDKEVVEVSFVCEYCGKAFKRGEQHRVSYVNLKDAI